MAAAPKTVTRRKPAGANGDRQRFAVNISKKAWDIAKAGAAITLKVRDRGQVVGTIQIGQGSLRWRSPHGRPGSGASHGRSSPPCWTNIDPHPAPEPPDFIPWPD